MKLGTYSTFDCPTEKISQAWAFLIVKFDEIGGRVRKEDNEHDFGMFPSFEIDFPEHLEDHTGDDDCDICHCESGEQCLLESWSELAEEVEMEYSKQFSEYL
jgi:hypothetical protein